MSKQKDFEALLLRLSKCCSLVILTLQIPDVVCGFDRLESLSRLHTVRELNLSGENITIPKEWILPHTLQKLRIKDSYFFNGFIVPSTLQTLRISGGRGRLSLDLNSATSLVALYIRMERDCGPLIAPLRVRPRWLQLRVCSICVYPAESVPSCLLPALGSAMEKLTLCTDGFFYPAEGTLAENQWSNLALLHLGRHIDLSKWVTILNKTAHGLKSLTLRSRIFISMAASHTIDHNHCVADIIEYSCSGK